MIMIVGISHTEKQDNKLEKIIYDFKPDAVCVELDEMSLKLIKDQLTEEQINSYYSNMPSTFKMLSMFKYKFEKVSSVDRMWDSKLVYRLSKDLEFKIIPIDIDKKKLYWDLEKEISFFEKLRILISVKKSFIFSSKKMEESDDYEKRFPTLKKYLIDKKNEYMIEEIKKNIKVYKKSLVIVGSNHLQYLQKLNVKDDLKIIDLKTFQDI